MADVFVSYTRSDRELVLPLVRILESNGYSVWWDVQQVSGDIFADAIEQQLAIARAVIVCWSDRSLGSRWVKEEAAFAESESKYLPVSFAADCRQPFGYSQYHCENLSQWDGESQSPELRQLLAAVQHKVQKAIEPVAQLIPETGAESRVAGEQIEISGQPDTFTYENGSVESVARSRDSAIAAGRSRWPAIAGLVAVVTGIAGYLVYSIDSVPDTQTNAGVEAIENEAVQSDEQSIEPRVRLAKQQYLAAIQRSVTRKWRRPTDTPSGIACTVTILQTQQGEVIEVRQDSCPNGSASLKKSVRNAVIAASPLPVPGIKHLFEREVSMTFRTD